MIDAVHEAALLALLQDLRREGYAFTAVTPATHARILCKRSGEARDLRDVFGWSLPFREGLLPPAMFQALQTAEALERQGELWKSRVRVSAQRERLFLHSAFPTDAADAVFFGPDTYRFLRMIEAELARLPKPARLVDIGAGSGAGGITAGAILGDAKVVLTDINPAALRIASVNARHAGVEAELVEASGLDGVEGAVDLVIANPPFMMDAEDRSYRNGGALFGAGLSLEWALSAARRLERGGHMLLYTGSAIVDGKDSLREALEERLPELGCAMRYAEIDPDIFGEELEGAAYREVERIAAIGAVITRER